ncbi:TIGR03943 family putative permease subunit [Bacillus weihaiensis]|uniref:TIGR03943 family protein n=1 Tax=Bacillus weihaiensis TaxID=1547283 RepID=A0A1L3MNV2_9BACI|nr:TIGR03943 family protein [Bacillus weihaiensis]APH03982.1 TIGR03943 family protein [Bacillus weihaiensis]
MEDQLNKTKFHIYIRGIILIGFTLLMVKLVITGKLDHFIAPKMVPFIYFSIIVFLFLGVMQIWRSGSKKIAEIYCDCGGDHGESASFIRSFFVYSLFILPIITGFLFPDFVLDSAVAAKRGFKPAAAEKVKENEDISKAEAYLNDPEAYMNELDESTGDQIAQSENAPDIPLEHPEGFEIQAPPEEFYSQLESEMLSMDTIEFTDENYIAMTTILDRSPEKFKGKKVEMTGFVFREADFTEEQFVLARFGLSCCVADASVFGTLASLEDAKSYGDDQWVKIQGTVTVVKYQEWVLPNIEVTKIERVEVPDSPYVYEEY